MNCRIGHGNENGRCFIQGCEWLRVFGQKCGTGIEPEIKTVFRVVDKSERINFEDRRPKEKVYVQGLNSGAFLDRQLRRDVFSQSNCTCYLCGEELEYNKFNIDHLIPLALGGVNHILNYRATHEECNTEKGNRLPTPEELERAGHYSREVSLKYHWMRKGDIKFFKKTVEEIYINTALTPKSI